MLVDEYGGEEDTKGEDKTAEPHHHPGDCPHVHHREVGVLNRHQRRGGRMVDNYCSDHQLVSHVENLGRSGGGTMPGAGGALASLGFAFLTWECHCTQNRGRYRGTGNSVVHQYSSN